PLVAGASALLLTGLLSAGLLQALIHQERTRTAEDRAQTAIEHAAAMGRAGAALELQLYLNHIALAERTLAAHNPSRAIRLLDECPPRLRHWEWHCLSRLCREDVLTLRGPAGHAGTVQAVAFSPDGRTLASAGFGGAG